MNPGGDDVIAAVATSRGAGAIGIVRISGTGSAELLSRIFVPRRRPDKFVSHRLYHGRITDGKSEADEVMAAVMRAPRSYTSEETVEIYTHGGTAPVQGVLSVVLRSGARQAQPGEFTRRAFLNGRIDLTQAEAVAALINAKTDAAIKAGLRQMSGGLSSKINKYRDIILTLLANIELSIDYPEHESEAMNLSDVQASCKTLTNEIQRLLETYKTGRVMTEGVRTAIVGKPNVGKSALLNAVLKEDRAIVTEIPGTTRDILTEPVSVKGVPLLLSDTAGIRDTDDVIEKIGTRKSLDCMEDAELVLWVADRSEPPSEEDFFIADKLCGRSVVCLLNKSDLVKAEGWRDSRTGHILRNFRYVLEISALCGNGLNELYDLIEKLFYSEMEPDGRGTEIIMSKRHELLLREALDGINGASRSITEDIAAVGLSAAYRALGDIIGQGTGEDVLDKIFAEFCVGK